MEKKLKRWQGWAIFLGSMVVVFLLGLLSSSLMERRAEQASVFNNKKVEIKDSDYDKVARNDVYRDNYQREFDTWKNTAQTTFKSEYNSSDAVDVLDARPNIPILWAGYAFSWDYTTPRGHMHAIEDITRSLRTGAPGVGIETQPSTCWTCKSPDVPRLMATMGGSADGNIDAIRKGAAKFYSGKWGDEAWAAEVANPIGCWDCHEAETMNLRISRPALVEAFERRGMDIKNATQQEMRTLVCAQCHVEYYFDNRDGKVNYLTFPWDKGVKVEEIEAYYDEFEYADYIHAMSKAPILKAQHPGYETWQMGIHGQRGVSCADCHMPYMSEGGVKFSDHQVQSPLAKMDRTCLVCHRQSEETLRQNVYDRQRAIDQERTILEEQLAAAHIEAAAAWKAGATEAEMQKALKDIRKAQWRWDFSVASHGAAFHAPVEIARILTNGVSYAYDARLALAKVLNNHGVKDVNIPTFKNKAEAQKYIEPYIAGKITSFEKLESDNDRFLKEVQPEWVKKAREKGRLTMAL
ncbi:MAG: ammonia-forming cytochrome c nitrite reductase subunit c552 [Bacteroidales bacterium]|nr:ammonia-forming cytochrome c nitrite reductase subunit c552 [Bacteroidales bacterium]